MIAISITIVTSILRWRWRHHKAWHHWEIVWNLWWISVSLIRRRWMRVHHLGLTFLLLLIESTCSIRIHKLLLALTKVHIHLSLSLDLWCIAAVHKVLLWLRLLKLHLGLCLLHHHSHKFLLLLLKSLNFFNLILARRALLMMWSTFGMLILVISRQFLLKFSSLWWELSFIVIWTWSASIWEWRAHIWHATILQEFFVW